MRGNLSAVLPIGRLARQSIAVALIMALSSCKTLHDPTTSESDAALPIVKRGMTPEEVEGLMGGGVIEDAPGLGKDRSVGIYRLIHVDYLEGKVLKCSARRLTISEPNKGPSLQLYLLEKLMKAGLSRQEVENINGQPSFGFENKPGRLTMVYPNTGIEVVYTGGVVLTWKKIYTFDKVGNGT